MNSILQKLSGLIILSIVLLVSPLYAQQTAKQQSGEQAFIQKGRVLAGFSLSFINASREDFNQEFERGFTHLSLQFDGLYFISDRIGLGPLLGYRFTQRDFGDGQSDDTRNGQFEFGVKGGWFLPIAKAFGGTGDEQFFVDGGASLLHNNFNREAQRPHYQLGFQVGTGFLFPVGERIALETKLGFQTRRREFSVVKLNPVGETVTTTETRWTKEAALSIGLKVKL